VSEDHRSEVSLEELHAFTLHPLTADFRGVTVSTVFFSIIGTRDELRRLSVP
jgi:hypothetical protein